MGSSAKPCARKYADQPDGNRAAAGSFPSCRLIPISQTEAAVTVLGFLADPAAVLREMGRTVRRGGRLAIGEQAVPASAAAAHSSASRKNCEP